MIDICGIVGDFSNKPLDTTADLEQVGEYLRRTVLPMIYREEGGLPLRMWLIITATTERREAGGWIVREASRRAVMELRVPSVLENRHDLFYQWGNNVATLLKAVAAFTAAETWVDEHDPTKDLATQPGSTSAIALTTEIVGDDGRVKKNLWLSDVAGDGVGEFGPWRKGEGQGPMISILSRGLE